MSGNIQLIAKGLPENQNKITSLFDIGMVISACLSANRDTSYDYRGFKCDFYINKINQNSDHINHTPTAEIEKETDNQLRAVNEPKNGSVTVSDKNETENQLIDNSPTSQIENKLNNDSIVNQEADEFLKEIDFNDYLYEEEFISLLVLYLKLNFQDTPIGFSETTGIIDRICGGENDESLVKFHIELKKRTADNKKEGRHNFTSFDKFRYDIKKNDYELLNNQLLEDDISNITIRNSNQYFISRIAAESFLNGNKFKDRNSDHINHIVTPQADAGSPAKGEDEAKAKNIGGHQDQVAIVVQNEILVEQCINNFDNGLFKNKEDALKHCTSNKSSKRNFNEIIWFEIGKNRPELQKGGRRKEN